MQVTETLNDGLKRGYSITLPAAELETKVKSKLAEAQPEIAMKGFRKGKVPMALLRKQYGPRLLGEALQETIDGALSSHMDSTGDRPAAQPEVKMTNPAWKEGEDVAVSVTYEKLPAVPDVAFDKVKLTRLIVKADDAAVAEALDNLAGTAKNFEDRKKGSKAKDGDQVIIDFVGKVDGEAFEGGTAADYPLVLGSNSFIPGFEPGLVGVKVGDEKDVEVTFPDNYQAPNLAGKPAVFSCTIKAVKEPKPAEVNDDLAKQFGAEDLAALKVQISDRLEAEYTGASRAVAKRALLDALDKVVTFELPSSLVDAESSQIAHQLYHEDHPEDTGHNHDAIDPTDEHKKLAVRRVKLGLLLADIGQKAEIKVTDAEFTQAILTQARQYPGQERAFFDFVQKNAQVRQQMQAPIFEDKVVDHVFGLASVTEKTATKEELQKAVEALEEE